MNIKITYNWLLEYLETDADPYELQKYLSLCGPGFERVDKVEDDYVFDIEVTTNRVDMASVFGIAQEAQSILPQFGKKAKLKFNPLDPNKYLKELTSSSGNLKLKVDIKEPDVCSRFTAVILDNVEIKPSPELIRKRLEWCDIRSINNVVDISNYIMLSLGQPIHMFDYDKIGKQTMIMRKSTSGEILTTLDGKQFKLPGDDIVIEDGNKRLVDLCGIMGGENSAISEKTKRIIFFGQTYNKRLIRRTSMRTGQRSVAATYFEKGLDEERVGPAMAYGLDLLREMTGGEVNSQLYDIYPEPYKQKHITVTLHDIQRLMGVDIEPERVESILTNLGFTIETDENIAHHIKTRVPRDSSDIHIDHQQEFVVGIPSFRSQDIEIKEDIIEEVARVYGYHNLPNVVQSTVYIQQPRDVALFLNVSQKVKYFLKHLGLNEMMNYSMISEELINQFDLKKPHLMLANTISEEIKFMRQSLIPSLVKNIKDNEGKKEALRFFELSKVYYPQENDLPLEKYRLSFATNTDFFDLKGIIEAVLRELRITDYEFVQSKEPQFLPNVQAQFSVGAEKSAGIIGQLKKNYTSKLDIKSNVYVAEIAFQPLIDNYRLLPDYVPPNQYAVVKLDANIEISDKKNFGEIKKKSFETSKLLTNLELIDVYKNTATIRFYFTSRDHNITDAEAQKELDSIKTSL